MSNCTMLTQTHVQQFNELTSSELRSSELIKVSALIFVCNLSLHTGILTGSWITFHRLQPSSGAPGPPAGCCTLGPPGSVGGKPAASLLDASELLLFERLRPAWVVMARQETSGWHNHATPPDFSPCLWSRRCQTLPQSPFSTTDTIYSLLLFRNYWGCLKFSELSSLDSHSHRSKCRHL